MLALQKIGVLSIIPLCLMLQGIACAADPTPTPTPAPKVLRWSGFDWQVRAGGGGPGPNNWDERNAWVDEQGRLHLKIANRDGVWSSTEIQLGVSMDRLGFGTFQTHMVGRPDQLDSNVVFGFYTYPPRDVGGDATNEIDIEFSKWGNSFAPIGNYTVWPAVNGAVRSWHGFDLVLDSDLSTHRFTWQSDKVSFQTLNGHRALNDSTGETASWVFDPRFPPAQTDNRLNQWYCSSHDPLQCISQKPQYFLINLWQVGGRAPTDNKEVELILTDFTYVPNGTPPSPVPSTVPTPTPVTQPTVVPTSGPTVPPTATPRPTATPVPGSCYTTWSTDAVYLTGQRVTRNGRNYEAKWWTQGNDPTTAGQWGPWLDLGACTGTVPTPTSVPTAQPTVKPTAVPTTPPTTAPTVTPVPPANPTPAPGCTPWQEGVPYAVGNCVSYQGKQYTALIAHTAPVGGNWTPLVVPVLWQVK